MKQNEDWAKVFCGTNSIHRIKCINNGCLMCLRWSSKHYCFKNFHYKTSTSQTMKLRRTKGKRTKPTSRKSVADAIGRDLALNDPNESPQLGTVRHWIHNPIEVT